MAGRYFQYIEYDLGASFQKDEEQLSFQDYLLARITLQEFKTSKNRNKFIDIDALFRPMSRTYLKRPRNRWKEIVNFVSVTIHRIIIDLIMNIEQENIKNIVLMVGQQLYDLFGKVIIKQDRELFLKYLVINISGTINMRSTIERILRDSNDFSVEWKFLFSCQYFAEENTVKKYFKLLPLPVKNWYFNLSSMECKFGCTPVCFWIWYIRKTANILQNGVCEANNDGEMSFIFGETYERNVIDLIFEWALIKGYDTAIYFLFEKFISRSSEKENILEREFLRLTRYNYNITNLIIYLISQIDGGVLPNWFNDKSPGLFQVLSYEYRWHKTLLELCKDVAVVRIKSNEYVAEFILTMLLTILCQLKKSGERTTVHYYRKTLEKLVNDLSSNIKKYIVELNEKTYYKYLKDCIDNMDGETAIIMLKISIGIPKDKDDKNKDDKNKNKDDKNKDDKNKDDKNKDDKNKDDKNKDDKNKDDKNKDDKYKDKEALRYLSPNNGDPLWVIPICNCSTDFMNNIFEQHLKDQDKCLDMREWIFHQFAYDAIVYYLVAYKFDNIEKFLDWTISIFPVEIIKFKRKMKRRHLLKIIKSILFGKKFDDHNRFLDHENKCYTGCPIDYSNRVLHWCLETTKEINKYKRYLRIYLPTIFYRSINERIENLKFDFLIKIFAWCNCTGKKLILAKRKILRDKHFFKKFSQKNDLFDQICLIDWCSKFRLRYY